MQNNRFSQHKLHILHPLHPMIRSWIDRSCPDLQFCFICIYCILIHPLSFRHLSRACLKRHSGKAKACPKPASAIFRHTLVNLVSAVCIPPACAGSDRPFPAEPFFIYYQDVMLFSATYASIWLCSSSISVSTPAALRSSIHLSSVASQSSPV